MHVLKGLWSYYLEVQLSEQDICALYAMLRTSGLGPAPTTWQRQWWRQGCGKRYSGCWAMHRPAPSSVICMHASICWLAQCTVPAYFGPQMH